MIRMIKTPAMEAGMSMFIIAVLLGGTDEGFMPMNLIINLKVTY